MVHRYVHSLVRRYFVRIRSSVGEPATPGENEMKQAVEVGRQTVAGKQFEDAPRFVTGLFEQFATRTRVRRFPFPRRAARQGKRDPSEAVAVLPSQLDLLFLRH